MSVTVSNPAGTISIAATGGKVEVDNPAGTISIPSGTSTITVPVTQGTLEVTDSSATLEITTGQATVEISTSAPHTHVVADITDIGSWTGSTSITTLGTISTGTWQGTAIAAAYLGTHNHAAGDINSGTLADARVAESNVTQHQAALSITESQISDLAHTVSLSVDTESNLLGSTPSSALVAFATDTRKLFLYQSATWAVASTHVVNTNANPNIGADEWNANDVGATYIADKHLASVSIGAFDPGITVRAGAVRTRYATDTARDELEHYDDGTSTWGRLLKGVLLDVTTSTVVSNDFEQQIDLFSGNSTARTAQNVPVVQRGKISIGAIPPSRQLIGRTLNDGYVYDVNIDGPLALVLLGTTHANRETWLTLSQLFSGELIRTDADAVYIHGSGLRGVSPDTIVTYDGEVVAFDGEVVTA